MHFFPSWYREFHRGDFSPPLLHFYPIILGYSEHTQASHFLPKFKSWQLMATRCSRTSQTALISPAGNWLAFQISCIAFFYHPSCPWSEVGLPSLISHANLCMLQHERDGDVWTISIIHGPLPLTSYTDVKAQLYISFLGTGGAGLVQHKRRLRIRLMLLFIDVGI